jgi:hypothetical protein
VFVRKLSNEIDIKQRPSFAFYKNFTELEQFSVFIAVVDTAGWLAFLSALQEKLKLE